MRNLLDPESPALQLITKLVYTVWLNLLWFLCCIPILTIGPSTTALFYCCQKMALDEEGYLTRSFFSSFRKNLKQGTLIGLLMTGLGLFLLIDGFVLSRLYNTSVFWAIVTAFYLVATAAWCIVLMWVFPLLAHFENGSIAMIKNSLLLGMRFLLCTALMAAIYIGMALLVIHVMTPLVIFGMGTCAYLCALLQKPILILLEEKQEKQEEQDEQDEQEQQETGKEKT